MVLTTGRQLEHWHAGAMTRRARVVDELEPEAVASLAPAELHRLGIAVGEPVRVTTRRGVIELKARADSNVAPGQVFIPFCYAEAAAATVLTNPQLDPIGKIPEFKLCAPRSAGRGARGGRRIAPSRCVEVGAPSAHIRHAKTTSCWHDASHEDSARARIAPVSGRTDSRIFPGSVPKFPVRPLAEFDISHWYST